MEQRDALIEYRVKVKQVRNADETLSDYIDFKRKVDRRNCNLKPHQHTYYNADLFLGMLRRAHSIATEGKEWCRLSELPQGVSVDTSGFLALVTVKVQV